MYILYILGRFENVEKGKIGKIRERKLASGLRKEDTAYFTRIGINKDLVELSSIACCIARAQTNTWHNTFTFFLLNFLNPRFKY